MQYYQQSRDEMRRYIPTNRKKVLEIGCGEAAFLSSIEGCQERWGIEPSDSYRVAEAKLSHVLHGTFDDVKDALPARAFDLVICNDVIEHMPNHQKFLLEIQNFLAPGGILVGSIPNVRFYNNLFQMVLEKDWLYTDDGILDRTHLAFFTEKSLKRAFANAGLSIIVFDRINKDIRPNQRQRTKLYLLAARVLSWITFGYFSDIRYLQFAFQVTARQ